MRTSWYNCSPVSGSSARWLDGGAHTLGLLGLLQPEPLSVQQITAGLASAGDTQTLKGRSASVSVGSLGSAVPSEHLWQVWGLILNVISPLLPSCWVFSFAVGYGVSFLVGSNILPLMVAEP